MAAGAQVSRRETDPLFNVRMVDGRKKPERHTQTQLCGSEPQKHRLTQSNCVFYTCYSLTPDSLQWCSASYEDDGGCSCLAAVPRTALVSPLSS